MKNFFKIIILWICTAFAAGTCPIWDKDSPCSCSESKSFTVVQCSGTSGSQSVISALTEVRITNKWQLQLDSVNIDELPESVSSASALELVRCNVRRLQKSEDAAWPNLNEVVLESTKFKESLWPQLKGARALKFIKVSEVVIPVLGQEFRSSLPSSVEYVEMRKTSTSKIEAGCMSHLSNLRYVFITDMPLSKFPRNALPSQMSQLHTFVLGNTQTVNLEANFFEGMPRLQVLMLNGNKFSTLNAQLFMPLQSHLDHLLAERNPLQCKCNLLWLKNFQKKRSINVIATCYDENVEQIKEIIDLHEEDYCF